MTEIVGSKNKAIVHLKEDLLNDETRDQILCMLSDESFENIRIMPDCHKGGTTCVGFTCKFTKISPNIIGTDIGCGMTCYPIGILKEKKLVTAERIMRDFIPMSHHYEAIVSDNCMDDYVKQVITEQNEFAVRYKEKFGTDIKVQNFNLDVVCNRLRLSKGLFLNQLGTLGHGNHFVEIDQDQKTNEMYLTVHSGSRQFGESIFTYYNKILKEKKQEHLEDEDLHNYLFDMIAAQKYAQLNRRLMIQCVTENIGIDYDESLIVESIHNYIDFKDLILRKGAISAHENEVCIVALNMRDGILICKGKGNIEWNWSCAHGAGRLWSRGECKKYVKLKDFEKEMRDVVSSTVCAETLDECPQAYKDSNLIIEAISPSVEITKQLKCVVNYKGFLEEEKTKHKKKK